MDSVRTSRTLSTRQTFSRSRRDSGPAGAQDGTYQVGRDQNVYMFKTDIRINNANQLVLRFNQQNFTGNNNENGGPLSVQEHSGNSVAKTTTFSGS